jgi:DNA-binding PucR family transcriptional regulator
MATQSKHALNVPGFHARAGNEVVRAAAAALAPCVEQVAAEIAGGVHGALPQLGHEPATVAATRAGALAAVAQFVSRAGDRIDRQRVELPPETARVAAEFVHRGIDMAGLLQAVRIGHSIFWEWWLGELRGVCRDPVVLGDAIDRASRLQFACIDRLSSQLAEAYEDERALWLGTAEGVRVRTVRAILDLEGVDVDVASTRLGYELRREHVGFVVSGEADPAAHSLGELRHLALAIAHAADNAKPLLVPVGGLALAGWVGGRAAQTAAALDGQGLPDLREDGIQVAFGTPAAGVGGFRRTHVEAMYALRVALLTRPRQGHVVRYPTVALVSLASADVEQARAFVAHELGPLARGDAETLRLAKTLAVYLAEGSSLDRAARRLGVHRNTVLNRVRRARQLLGHDLRERTLELQVALAIAGIVEVADILPAR